MKKRTEQDIRKALNDLVEGEPVHSDKWPEDDSDKILSSAIDELIAARSILEDVRTFCFAITAKFARK